MQLLRDNLTLWTSSDGGEGEAAQSGEPAREAEKAGTAAEPKADAPESGEGSAEAPRPTDS